MCNQYWLIQLEIFLVPFSYTGINNDFAAFGLIKLWDLQPHLSKMTRA